MRIHPLFFVCSMLTMLTVSCTGNDTTSPTGQTEQATVKLTVNTGTQTRISGTVPTTAENTISDLWVCFYKSSDGSIVTMDEYDSGTGTKAPAAGGTISIATTTDADSVYVIANVPADKFKGMTAIKEVRSAIQNLNYTTYSGTATQETTAGSQSASYIPMVDRELTNLSSSSTTQNITATLSRLVARVAITSIATNFSSTGGYSGASFIPTEVFMYNANDQLMAETIGGSGTNIGVSKATLRSGEITDATTGTTPGALSTDANYSYLSSGYLSSIVSAGVTTPYTIPYYFYVFPNTDTSHPTKIVIKGWWKDTSTSSYEVVYYPVIINHEQSGTTYTSADGKTQTSTIVAGSKDQITANTCYSISATIQGKGSSSPGTDITPATINLTVKVASWTDAGSQSVTFN